MENFRKDIRMKVCKLKPDKATCSNCLISQLGFGIVKECADCKINKDYELISVGSSFFIGSYAVILDDGELKKVSFKKIYDVREVIK